MVFFDSAKSFFNKAKNFFQEKITGGPKKPDIVIKPDDDFLQSMGKVLNSVKIQFKEMGGRISGNVKKGWEKRDLLGKMLICICAIPAAPVVLIGLFIESLVELFKALRNVYNASMKALEQGQQKGRSERCKKVTVERFLEEMFICIYAISVSPVVSSDLFIKPQSDLSKAERNVYNASMKALEQE